MKSKLKRYTYLAAAAGLAQVLFMAPDASATPHTPCKGVAVSAQLNSLQIPTCPSSQAVCVIPRSADHDIRISITPTTTLKRLHITVRTDTLGLLAWPGIPHDGCTVLAGGCPKKPGVKYSGVLRIPANPNIPLGTYDLEIRMSDQNLRPAVCSVVSVKIV